LTEEEIEAGSTWDSSETSAIIKEKIENEEEAVKTFGAPILGYVENGVLIFGDEIPPAPEDDLLDEFFDNETFDPTGMNQIGGDENKNKFNGKKGMRNAMLGFGGDDKLYGKELDDVIIGGTGNDKLFGYAGNDRMSGGDGNDYMKGGLGDDGLHGGTGNDNIKGEEGNDRIEGHDGKDKIYGDAGDDLLSGGKGNDNISGGEGNDIAVGGDGSDVI